MRNLMIVVVCTLVLNTGCWRTHYVNFTDPDTTASAEANLDYVNPPSSWQNFFVWGWFPSEQKIRAGKSCGGAANLESVETRQTFLQGLVAAVAGFYINIYSPYTAQVSCKEGGQSSSY